MNTTAPVILEATFSPKVKTYLLISSLLTLIATVMGIVLIPLWIIAAPFLVKKYYERLECELTNRSLRFKKGYIFHTERTIPLDKIQDLTFKEGPVLRWLELSILQIETAGQSQQGTSDLKLIGIVDAADFRNRVLEQRDKVTENVSPGVSASTEEESTLNVLKDIRQSLQSIEEKMRT